MLKSCLCVGIGGFLGAISRYFLAIVFPAPAIYMIFPYKTLLANLLGCFALGFLLSLSLEALKLRPNIKLGLTTGFIGSLTTFATLEVELLQNIQQGFLIPALAYIILSLVLGYGISYLGIKLGEEVTT